MASREPTLVSTFDEIVAASNVLIGGTEKVFSEFVSSQMGVYAEINNLEVALRKKAEKIEAKDIELKLSRTSLQRQMDKCAMQEERLKEYEKQFMILKVLISSDDKLINLNEAEKRSLAILRQKSTATQSPGAMINSTDDWGTPETSVNVTDATDLEDDDGAGFRAHWKRRRTCSSEYTLDSSLSVSKRKRSVDPSVVLDEHEPPCSSITSKPLPSSLGDQPLSETNKEEHTTSNRLPSLEQHFKRPPPGKNRRKPSQGHLVRRNVEIQPPNVPPLDLPKCEDSAPVPSAPPGFPDRILSEVEVALVNSGLLSPERSPQIDDPDANPDILAAFPHSPLSPVSIQPVPSSPSMGGTPRLYPVLDTQGVDHSEYGVLDSPTYVQPLGLTRTNSDINMTRKHTFQTKTALKLENCEVCKKRVNVLGKSFLKCQDCKAICCVDCQNKVPLPCVPTVRTPKKKSKDVDLAAYCPNVIPRVPSLIVHCVKELESRGLNQVGLYRVPGSDRSIKDLRERLVKVKGTPNIDKIDDVNVLCGCIKQFLISLKEPLVTNALNPCFLRSIDENSEEKILAALFESIAKLPTCNRDTLAFMILHLQKIIERSEKNKMPVDSIARVFGPTIIGSTSSDPKIAVKDIEKQRVVMIKLLGISSAYWRQFLSTDDHLESGSPRLPEHPNLPSTPMLNSPSTPELMPIPQSPFLGPCQSPRGPHRSQYAGASSNFMRTPVVTRSISANSNIMNSVSRSAAKKNGFFAAIN